MDKDKAERRRKIRELEAKLFGGGLDDVLDDERTQVPELKNVDEFVTSYDRAETRRQPLSGVGARLKTPHQNLLPVKKLSDPTQQTPSIPVEEARPRTRSELLSRTNSKLFSDRDVDLVEGLDQVKPVRDPKKSVIAKMKERHGVAPLSRNLGDWGEGVESPLGHGFAKQASFGRPDRLDRQSSQRSELFSGGLLPSTFSLADLEVVQPLTRYERNENLGMTLFWM